MKKKEDYRIENDSLGEGKIPSRALWGLQTQRAKDNFPISGLLFPREFIGSLGLIKRAATEVNLALGLLKPPMAKAIIQAAGEVETGQWDSHFIVDIFQTGSGTSTNMNANEVIANRAIQLLGGEMGSKQPVHPNDHVNLGQSSNDVFPTSIHITVYRKIQQQLVPALKELHRELESKARSFSNIIKLGRTHLQDATPVTLGQEFTGYATMIQDATTAISSNSAPLSSLTLGGTAVGTGINRHPLFPQKVIHIINETTGLDFKKTGNHFAEQGARDALVQAHATLKTLAVSLTKIANDLRWMSSGPHGGLSEISLPALQPGSSIMPGKVNPVIPEALIQVAAQVIGNDTAVTLAGQSGNFELNVMMPMMAYNTIQSIELLTNSINIFAKNCIRGIKANEKRCLQMVEKSLAMVTALAPIIGYDQAAEIARLAQQEGKSINEVLIEKKLLPLAEISRILDPRNLL